MKKNFIARPLLVILTSLLFIACSNDDGAIDSLISGDDEIVNEENSVDNDSDDDSDNTDDGSNEDSSDDDSNNSDDNEGNNDDSSDDGNMGQDDSNGDDDSNNDSSNDDSSEATLVGDWRLVSATVNDGQASTVFNGSTLSFPFTSTSQDEDVGISFQENPNVIQGMGQYTNVIEFSFLSLDFTEEATFDSPLTDGNWEMNNDELIISDSSEANGTFTITELTATTLILQIDFEETVPTDDFDLDATGVLVIELARN
ncbi:lipocalin family protein [Flagellimonas meridianipacifica]|uniref:Lipocalin-like protein n=1 Tax=Flagellimonas meridianipacifica TaxID=1080225 RepID=A0A2T0MDD9_9FLAO|nr:lipocalin family protein [Allomuricauda pacifica]PRX55504.1 lipocalin-like protein [Allomuricauda pacifica]